MKRILYKILRLSLYCFQIFPIKRSRILFKSYYGKYYNDNPKAISDFLDCNKYELVWIVNDPTEFVDDRVVFVKAHSVKCLYYLATSKVWIDNCRKPKWVVKRKEQYYIQTWHGSISFKQIEKDAEEKLTIEYVNNAKFDSKNIDLILSNSKWSTNLIRRSFWYKGEILECGTPRLDKLINCKESYEEKCKKANLDASYEYILYAPTFRDELTVNTYNIDFDIICNELGVKTGKKWKVLYRLHPNMKEKHGVIEYSENTMDMTEYPNIYDLIGICSYLITDYSSTMFEAGFIEKNVILYWNDIFDYERQRGMYFQLEDLPFPCAKNNNELVDAFQNIESGNYLERLNAFNRKLDILEEGTACFAITNIIEKVTNLNI